jgi:hypothetical protein
MNWINVKEQLPISDQYVIGWVKYDDGNEEFRPFLYDHNRFYTIGIDDYDDYTNNITHWMIPTKPE